MNGVEERHFHLKVLIFRCPLKRGVLAQIQAFFAFRHDSASSERAAAFLHASAEMWCRQKNADDDGLFLFVSQVNHEVIAVQCDGRFTETQLCVIVERDSHHWKNLRKHQIATCWNVSSAVSQAVSSQSSLFHDLDIKDSKLSDSVCMSPSLCLHMCSSMCSRAIKPRPRSRYPRAAAVSKPSRQTGEGRVLQHICSSAALRVVWTGMRLWRRNNWGQALLE